ncbi:hypothetical protein Q8A73_002602 [Channa argus]|nr:hypothetical protein Q8A73_002602 [Channa argus]
MTSPAHPETKWGTTATNSITQALVPAQANSQFREWKKNPSTLLSLCTRGGGCAKQESVTDTVLWFHFAWDPRATWSPASDCKHPNIQPGPHFCEYGYKNVIVGMVAVCLDCGRKPTQARGEHAMIGQAREPTNFLPLNVAALNTLSSLSSLPWFSTTSALLLTRHHYNCQNPGDFPT